MASAHNLEDEGEDITDAIPSDYNSMHKSPEENLDVLVPSETTFDLVSDGDLGHEALSLTLSDDVATIASYNTSHRRRGRMVVICNSKFEEYNSKCSEPGLKLKPRVSEKDINALKDTFENTMHFECSFLEDQTAEDMYKTMLKESREDHDDCDCFLAVFLSHGGRMGTIFGVDDSIAIDKLVEPLKTCKSLFGKPKLVLVQACRGESIDHGMTISHDGGGSSTHRTSAQNTAIVLPPEEDFLYVYSTADGYVAFNNPKQGSWFIQALCAEFKANYKKCEVMQMLTRVCHKIAYEHASYTPSRPETHNLKQVSSVTTTLTKALYFK